MSIELETRGGVAEGKVLIIIVQQKAENVAEAGKVYFKALCL
jgi:hypothetical protein